MKVGDLVRLIKPAHLYEGKNETGVIVNDFSVMGMGIPGVDTGESKVYKVLTPSGKVCVFLPGWIEKIDSNK